jgi:sialate O-acetylesterase
MRAALLILSAASAVRAALTLPTHFASSMVLQRGAPIVFWGRDTPGESVSVTYRGAALPPATADATGRFAVTLPALPANATPDLISITSSSGSAATLSDVVVGDVFVCSGQSNMEIFVSWSARYNETLARADALGPMLRLLSVALEDAYVNATTPSDNFTAIIPWSRASNASAVGFSAFCYNFGSQVVGAHPDVPIGLIANPWGGVPIQVWMSPAALAKCSKTAAPVSAATRRAVDIAAAADRAVSRRRGVTASPQKPSCLYNSMMAPIVSIPVTAFLW